MAVNLLNIFSSIREKRLDEALARYEENPGIEETLRVVRLLMKSRDYKQAFMYADNGYQRFPASRELLEARQYSMRRLALEECRDLERRVSAHPRAETVAKIVEIRRSLNDFRSCEKLVKRWKTHFLKSWVLQFAIAKYLFQRSLIEKDPRLATRCLSQLEHACSLRPDNYKTLLYLATLLHQLGKKSQALAAATKILELYPDDPRATALVGYIRNTPGEPGSKGGPASVAPPTADIEEIERRVFEELVGTDHLRAAIMYPAVEIEGAEPAVHFAESEGALAERGVDALADLAHSLTVSSQRMGIGELSSCSMEGESWNLYFHRYSNGQLVLYTDTTFKEEDFARVREKLSPRTQLV